MDHVTEIQVFYCSFIALADGFLKELLSTVTKP